MVGSCLVWRYGAFLGGSSLDMKIRSAVPFLAWILFAAFFVWGTQRLSVLPSRQPPVDSLVAMPPILLLGIYGGDRYLAADIESARLLGVEVDSSQKTGLSYYQMAHEAISVLNSCHEDNFYIANAILAWGGAQDEAFRILGRATACRFWDDWPPFFYGYNQFYFRQDHEAASRYMQIAADRKGENQVMFQRLAITLKAQTFPDNRQALRFLRAQKDASHDARLRRSLNFRIVRLEGLIQLEDASVDYQKRFGKPLVDPGDLLKAGLLAKFPDDPLRLGYTFDPQTGRFGLRSLNQNRK